MWNIKNPGINFLGFFLKMIYNKEIIQHFLKSLLDFLYFLFIIIVREILKLKVMSTEETKLYDYTQKEHDEWVRKLQERFGENHVEETFRWKNSIIEVEVVKSQKCQLKLTLDFGRSELKKQHASILCTYGTLQEIRRFVSKGYECWDDAVTALESLRNSSMKEVRKMFKDPKKRSYKRRSGGKK